MSDTTISVRIDEHIHNEMKMHDEINWSGILRNSIVERLERLEQIDTSTAKKALQDIAELRKARTFDHGKNSTEIIRGWREKRK